MKHISTVKKLEWWIQSIRRWNSRYL